MDLIHLQGSHLYHGQSYFGFPINFSFYIILELRIFVLYYRSLFCIQNFSFYVVLRK